MNNNDKTYKDIFNEIVNRVNNQYSYNWNEQQKEIAMREFSRFIALKIKYNDYQHILLSPGPVIDNIWHEFLLRPQDYYNYCMLLSGKIINHNPVIDSNVITRYKNTLNCYKEEFGELPPSYIWPVIEEPAKKPFTKPSSANKITIYVIDEISDPKKSKTFKITTPDDISYWTLINYLHKISGINTRIGLKSSQYSNWNGTSYNRCLTSETLSVDKKMKEFGMHNGSRYKLENIDPNMGC